MIFHNKFNCVCDVVEIINILQNTVEEQRAINRYRYLLSPIVGFGDTIPFFLLFENGSLFKAFANVDRSCYRTVFFRIEAIHESTATLRLLLPTDNDGKLIDLYNKDVVCKAEELLKTNNFIKLDLTNICAIQCLSPRLIK